MSLDLEEVLTHLPLVAKHGNDLEECCTERRVFAQHTISELEVDSIQLPLGQIGHHSVQHFFEVFKGDIALVLSDDLLL